MNDVAGLRVSSDEAVERRSMKHVSDFCLGLYVSGYRHFSSTVNTAIATHLGCCGHCAERYFEMSQGGVE
jgi:hypothetical protein